MALPWELDASSYLAFARTDLKQGGLRGRVNALSNAKRALHAQADGVLYCAGFWDRAKERHWSFDTKFELLAEMEIAAPGMLGRINGLRNKVEHDYAAPDDTQQLADLIDAVELFMSATRSYASARYSEVDFVRTYRGVDRSVAIEFSESGKLNATIFDSTTRTLKVHTPKRFRALQVAVYVAAHRNGTNLGL